MMTQAALHCDDRGCTVMIQATLCCTVINTGCSVLHSEDTGYTVLHCDDTGCIVLHSDMTCCTVLHCDDAGCTVLRCDNTGYTVLHCDDLTPALVGHPKVFRSLVACDLPFSAVQE